MSALFPSCCSSIQVRNFYSFAKNHQNVHKKWSRGRPSSCVCVFGWSWAKILSLTITSEALWSPLNSSESWGCGVIWENVWTDFCRSFIRFSSSCCRVIEKCYVMEIFSGNIPDPDAFLFSVGLRGVKCRVLLLLKSNFQVIIIGCEH